MIMIPRSRSRSSFAEESPPDPGSAVLCQWGRDMGVCAGDAVDLCNSGSMSGRHVTTGKAAEELGVGLTTLQRWAHQGLVTPTLRTAGGHLRWDLDDLKGQLRAMDPAAQHDSTKPEPQPVVAATVTSEHGVLVGRRNDGKLPWTFISGEIEPGESPADAGVREVKEETGLQVEAGKEIGRHVHPATGRTMIYMAASPTHGTDVFVGDQDELAEVRWVSLAEAEDLMQPYGMFRPVREFLARSFG
jgi:8-oxo-dGTP pyrophosphatase MutT (NUDIX family)